MSLSDLAFTVEFNPNLRPGSALIIMNSVSGLTLVYRHPSEWASHVSGAKWHPNGERCPTWTDECRCMLGGEA